MATITKYATDAGTRYRVRWYDDERRERQKRGFVRKRDAEEFASRIAVALSDGTYTRPTAGNVTVEALGDAWIARQTHLKASTKRGYVSGWENYVKPRWGSVRASGVRKTAVSAWVAEMSEGRSYTTVTRNLGILRSILADAVDDRIIPNNPAEGIKNLPTRGEGRQTFLTHEQLHALANAAEDRRALILTLGYCGLRWGEATALRVRDVNLVKNRLRIERNAVEVGSRIVEGTPKNHERRSVPFPAFLRPVLAEAMKDKLPDALVFPGPAGDYLRRPKNERSWWVKACEEARSGDDSFPEGLTRHDLRHTAASLAISAGVNIKALQRMLGHSSASLTLDRYGHLFPDDLDSVATGLDAAVRALGLQAG
ncbi:tyrosine-type recombinase/integrase [Brevibacterium samyangense]|uniref:Site-specific integrase n=1 Tax=Brevibacterium samyangense TaxID=366888 RepID=A0ABN2TND1_9MICO